MPITYKQTTVMQLAGCPLQLTGFEAPPVAPPEVQARLDAGDTGVGLEVGAGKCYYWWKSGVIEYKNGDSWTFWYPKPTIKDAVAYAWKTPYDYYDPQSSAPRRTPARSLFQFHGGGAVSAFCYDVSHFWSMEPVESEPVKGRILEMHICDNGEWNFQSFCVCTEEPEYESDADSYDSYYRDCGCARCRY